MDWMVFLVDITKTLAWPLTVLFILFWFKSYVTQLLEAAGRVIKERQFKVTAPGVSFEATGAVEEQLRSLQAAALPAPSPALEPSKVADLIEARRFIVRDEAGKARAEFAVVGKEGEKFPMIRFFDANGNLRAAMSADFKGTPRLLLRDHDGSSVVLGMKVEGGPALVLTHEAEHSSTELTHNYLVLSTNRVIAVAPKSGAPTMVFRDSEGQVTAVVPERSE
jgi:hypothetical protein